MSKIVLVCPGQGGQFKGMVQHTIDELKKIRSLKRFFDAGPYCSPLFCMLNSFKSIMGYDPIEASNDEEKLSQTLYLQPLIFLTTAMVLGALREINEPKNGCPLPDEKVDTPKFDFRYILGHSLGEFSAIFGAGFLDFETVLRLVKHRAEFMYEVSTGEGQGMWAILGKDLNVQAIEDELRSTSTLSIANYNSHDQVVISGLEDTFMEYRERIMVIEGVNKIRRLGVSGAFHSSLMNDAASQFRNNLDDTYLKWGRASIFYVLNYWNPEAVLCSDPVYLSMLGQMTAPVRFQQMIEYTLQQDVDTFIELSPGKTLTNSIKK